MSLSEVEFAFFFPFLLLVYWVLPRRAALQNGVLLVASVFFYATWNPKLVPLFLGSTALDFAVLRAFAQNPLPPEGAPAGARERAEKTRRRWLWVGLVNNLAALLWFKYVGFLADSMNGLLGAAGLAPSLPVLKIILPLGISFYTMSRMGVLIDTYYDRIKPVRSPLVWFTFTAFFPQLIAGPIGRGGELFPQYEAARRPDPEAFVKALAEFAVGFVLKVYVAAHVGAALVDPVFGAPGTFTRGAHAMALVGYAVQVFGDFAGYSLIAIGVARFVGIALPQNFDFPFLSTTPMEVWRRWHMSLNRWLFDYVYSPMVTGEGFMRDRIGLGLVVVMLVSGIWHGATWTYVLWGAMHGVWLLVHYRYDLFYRSLCRKDRAWVARRKSAAYKLAGWALTIGFFVVSLAPFRAMSMPALGAFLRGLFVGGAELPDPMTIHPLIAIALVAAWHVLHLSRFDGLRESLARAPVLARGAALGVVIVLLVMFAPVGAGTFIYAQF